MSWQEDARFVGAFIRGGDWEIGLRVARNLDPLGRPRSPKVSQSMFSCESGLSERTVKRYLDAWEHAADDGVVDHAADLGPNDEFDWKKAGLTQSDWLTYYGKARYGESESKRKPSKREVEKAIASDPVIAEAARKAVSKKSTAAEEVIAEHEAGDPLINAAQEETERRWAIKELLKAAKSISEKASEIASYGVIGVADEVVWMQEASGHLTDAQWSINASIYENYQEAAK